MVVRVVRDSPATASSAVRAGGFSGGAVSPVGFGLLLSATSYPTAWLTACVTMLLAGALLMCTRQIFRSDLAGRRLRQCLALRAHWTTEHGS